MINVIGVGGVYLSGDTDTLIKDLAVAIRGMRKYVSGKIGPENADRRIRAAVYLGMHDQVSIQEFMHASSHGTAVQELVDVIADDLLSELFGNEGEEI